MGTLAELTRRHTRLGPDEVDLLRDLVAYWGLLADLCFSDLILMVPVAGGGHDRDAELVILSHIRPTTGQSLYGGDRRGERLRGSDRPEVVSAIEERRIIEGTTNSAVGGPPVQVTAIPVVFGGRVVAVLTREGAPGGGRRPGQLETAYLAVFDRLAQMIADGTLRWAPEGADQHRIPRVGDGAIVFGSDGVVEFASPNAVSTLHRVGIHFNVLGAERGRLGLDVALLDRGFERGESGLAEFAWSDEVTLVLRCVPLTDDRRVIGVLLLIRDVSELRAQDRLLRSKDAMIREIHHRVKNNLQTISALLRLQSRRSDAAEVRAALDESVRRIGSIALVHDVLSRDVGDQVALAQILRPLVAMTEEHLRAAGNKVRISVQGTAGELSADVATPLAVVLNELLQNVADHAFDPAADGDAIPEVGLRLARDGARLEVSVTDNGVGLPEGFDLERSTGLGLSIVRTLVESELGGSLSLEPGADGGTRAHLGFVPRARNAI